MEEINLSERSYGGEMRIEQHSLDHTNLVSRDGDNSSFRLFSESRTRVSNDEFAARHGYYQKKRLSRVYDHIGTKEDLNAHTNDSTKD